MSRSAYPPITEEDTDVGKLGTAKKGIEDAEMLHPLQIGGRDLVRRRRAGPSMRDWSALLEGFRVSADSRAELFGRPLSSLTATWFRTSPVL